MYKVRSVVGIGDSKFVSLPHQWVKRMNVCVGDKVLVVDGLDGSLVLSLVKKESVISEPGIVNASIPNPAFIPTQINLEPIPEVKNDLGITII